MIPADSIKGRKMDHQFIPTTREGLEKSKAELQRLKREERPKAIEAIATARGHGDLSENAEYDAAKEHQEHLEARIADLEDKVNRARIIEATAEEIVFGAHVKVQEVGSSDIEEYQLVGPEESDPIHGKISTHSPMGKAFLRKKKGDVVEVTAPNGVIKMKVLDFWYK